MGKQILRPANSAMWLQVAAGVFLVTLGVTELSVHDAWFDGMFRGVSQPFGRDADALNIIASILELCGGVALLAVLFTRFPPALYRGLLIAVLAAWVLRILYHYVFTDFAEPDFLIWLNGLAFDAVFALVLGMFARGKG